MEIEISVEVIDARISEGITLIDKARIGEQVYDFSEPVPERELTNYILKEGGKVRTPEPAHIFPDKTGQTASETAMAENLLYLRALQPASAKDLEGHPDIQRKVNLTPLKE